MSSIHVTRKEFQHYMDCSQPTSLKKYHLYQELAEKDERLELTINDLAKIDDLPLDIVKQRCGKK